jgi:hypothetical protein
MLICAKCHRSNAPWAKLCNACKESLTDSSPDTWMAPALQTQNEPPQPLEPKTVTVVENWNPDTEWHGAEDIDTTKILDARSNEPPTLSRFDSQPIPVTSRSRLEAEHFEFEHPNRSSSKRLFGLISGLICIGVLGSWAINYLHSTTQTANSRQVSTAKSTPDKAAAALGAIKSSANAPNSSETIEQVVPNSQLKPLMKPPAPSTPAARNTTVLPSQTGETLRAQAEAQKPRAPVFVMSASEAIATTPADTARISGPRPQIHTQSTARKAEPKPVENRPENRPIAKVAPRSETKFDAGSGVGSGITSGASTQSANPSLVKADTKTPRYPVLVPVPAAGSGSNSAKNSKAEQRAELGNQGAGAAYPAESSTAQSSTSESTPISRLHLQQQMDCRNAAFLNKGICEERTRLSFCKSRGSEHPDCSPNGNRFDP